MHDCRRFVYIAMMMFGTESESNVASLTSLIVSRLRERERDSLVTKHHCVFKPHVDLQIHVMHVYMCLLLNLSNFDFRCQCFIEPHQMTNNRYVDLDL